MLSPRRFCVGILSLACIARVATAQAVHVLTNGSGTDLQVAIDSALDGDTLLLHGGSFASVHVGDKALSIVSEPEQSTSIQVLDVTGLSAGKRVVLSGLLLLSDDAVASVGFPPPPRPALSLASCAGSVRLQNVHCLPFVPDSGAVGARIVDCDDVAFLDCELMGGARRSTDWFSAYFGPGAAVQSSGVGQVAFYACNLRGGRGMDSHWVALFPVVPLTLIGAVPGAAGANIDGTTTYFGASQARGGDGGRGVGASCDLIAFCVGSSASNGAAGGTGIDALNAPAFVFDCTIDGGSGGAGGAGANCSFCSPPTVRPPGADGAHGSATAGNVSTLPGLATRLHATPLVRELGSIAIDVNGTPGDLVTLAISQGSPWILAPTFQGVFLYGPGVRRFTLGMIPGSGVLSTTLPFGPLPVGVESSTRYLQLFVRDPSNATHLGTAAVVKIVGQAF